LRTGKPGPPERTDPLVLALTAARQSKGWSFTDVGRAAGVTAESIRGAESGRHAPTLPTLRRWASALGFDLRLVEEG
jgi:transcriptional regulator with XRE-family HTH domain